MYSHKTQIGEWVETESRTVRRADFAYAADYEVLQTKPGRYPLYATFDASADAYHAAGKRPYWVMASIDAERIDGKNYSGAGGLIIGSRDMPRGAAPLPVQIYGYELWRVVERGAAVVDPQWQHYVDDSRLFLEEQDRKNAWRQAAIAAHLAGEAHDAVMPGSDPRWPVKCSSCDSERRQSLWDDHRFGWPHDYDECDHCKNEIERGVRWSLR